MIQTLSIQNTARLIAVLNSAAKVNDSGVVAWVDRTFADAKMLGRLRDKDVKDLERLERTYSNDFYTTRQIFVQPTRLHS